ncbi:MAG: tetratricopeptide repeat protein [Planctomycetota bacterium]|jgi:tetratricopeptide (TPR) repeat protein
MKTKRTNPSHSFGCKPEACLTASFRFWFRASRLLFLSCYLLVLVGHEGYSYAQADPNNQAGFETAEASPDSNAQNVLENAPEIAQKMRESAFSAVADPNSGLGRQLWRARIGIPNVEKDESGKNELQRIIEQIRSIKFVPEQKKPEPVIVIEPTPTTEPNESLPITDASTSVSQAHSELELPDKPIPDKTLQMLQNASQHMDQLGNPLELAEVLFISENAKEAASFYREALNRKRGDDKQAAQDRAWILFQIGNCLRTGDPLTAKKIYVQLINEYPDSPWTDLAKARGKLLDWYEKDRPRTLIGDNVSQGP